MVAVSALFMLALPVCAYAAELSETEIDLKSELKNDLLSIEEAEAGEEYAENELMVLCSSMDEAIVAAGKYNEYIMSYFPDRVGQSSVLLPNEPVISVRDYSFGVAVLTIVDPAIISVEEIVELAADVSNNLPPVYANVCESLEEVSPIDYQKHIGAGNLYVNTANEYFSDPNTKILTSAGSSNSEYQYYHEVIDTKFCWEQLDAGKLISADGTDLREALGNIVVAVIDSGAYAGNDLKDCLVDGQCFYPGCEACGATDGHGHGSNVSGIIADAANGINGRGIASGVKIMPLRVVNSSGSGNSSNSVRALHYATQAKINYDAGIPAGTVYEGVPSQNVRVINMSLGSAVYNTAYAEAIRDAYNAGIVVCGAAGNSDVDILSFPARYDYCVAVASVNSDYEKANYSSYSSDADIAAPGGTTDYDDRMSDSGYLRVEYVYASGCSGPNSLHAAVGTSQAAPMASAVAALLSAQSLSRTPDDILAVIKSTAHSVNGSGLGAGCINVAGALGISTNVAAPEATVSGASVHFEAHNPNSVIYYTVGEVSDPLSVLKDSDVAIYNGRRGEPSDWIGIPADYMDENMTVSAVTLLYGHLSNVTSVILRNDHCGPEGAFSIHIEDSNKSVTGGKVAAGMTLTPKVVRDDKKSLPPGISFTWSLVNAGDEDYVSVDPASGLVTAKDNAAMLGNSHVVGLRAVNAEYGLDAQMNITVYPISSGLSVRNAEVSFTGSTYALSNNVIIDPTDTKCMKLYRVVSDNPAVAKATVPVGNISRISLYLFEAGTANITVTALDGSGVSATFAITSNPSLQIVLVKSETGKMTYFSGDTIRLIAVGNKNIIPDHVIWEIADNPYITISDDGVISRKSDAPEITNKAEILISATALKSGASKQARVCITCLPTPVNPVNPGDSESSDGSSTPHTETYGTTEDGDIWVMNVPTAILMQPTGATIKVYGNVAGTTKRKSGSMDDDNMEIIHGIGPSDNIEPDGGKTEDTQMLEDGGRIVDSSILDGNNANAANVRKIEAVPVYVWIALGVLIAVCGWFIIFIIIKRRREDELR